MEEGQQIGVSKFKGACKLVHKVSSYALQNYPARKLVWPKVWKAQAAKSFPKCL
jgi:hypothetical protein